MTSEAVNILERLSNNAQLRERGLSMPMMGCFLVSNDDGGISIDDNDDDELKRMLMRVYEPNMTIDNKSMSGDHFLTRVCSKMYFYRQ